MKNIFKRTYVLIGKRNSFVGLTIIGALTFLLSPIVYLQSQSQEKLQKDDKILEKKNDFNPPVTITSVNTRMGEIKADTPFVANNDWFQGLSVTVRNDSDKPVTYIALSVLFPRPEEKKEELDLVVPLGYGESPFPTEDGHFLSTANTAQPIKPGESIDIALSDYDYSDVKKLLMESGYTMDIKKIRVYVTSIGFSDETIWMGDKIYKFDKDNPGKLIPIADSKKKLKN